jgi:toxic protein SymE
MANADSKPALNTIQEQHHYTVGYLPNGGFANPAPAINLKGRWLERAGFTTGTLIKVAVVDGQLIISPLSRTSLLNDIRS